MEVYLYHRAQDLPFGKNPHDPVTHFNPDEQRQWKVGVGDESFGNMIASYQYHNKRFEDTWAWPIICGLYASCMPLKAHVSFAVAKDKVFRHKRSSLAIQITAPPPYEPFCFYGKDRVAGSLWHHLDVKRASKSELQSETFWHALFESELRLFKDTARTSVENMVERSKMLHAEGDRLRLDAVKLRQAISVISD